MRLKILLLLILALSACSSLPEAATLPADTAVTSPPADESPTTEPLPDPFFPKPGDELLTRGNAFVSEMGLLVRESYPPQVVLSVSGELPTPCHQLRTAVAAPDPEHKIVVEVYSLVNPDMNCTQVLKPFAEQINLGSFPGGHYAVWVNGQLAGEFDS
jgi:hypothetical protein